MKTISYVEGNTPTLPMTLTGQDVSGCTITLRVGMSPLLEKTASITDGPNGEFQFVFVAGDLQKGVFPAEVEINNGGNIRTYAGLTFDIVGKVAAPA